MKQQILILAVVLAFLWPVCTQAEIVYKVIDLGTLGRAESVAYSINDANRIVGQADYGPEKYQYRATLFDPTGAGNNTNLGPLRGPQYSSATSINNKGQIVGWVDDARSMGSRATLFDSTGDSTNLNLVTLGDKYSSALCINNAGQIVGQAENNEGHSRATLFDATGAGNNIDLNTLIDPISGWTLTSANDINNSGWIVGQGINPQGKSHAFLLVPCRYKLAGDLNDDCKVDFADFALMAANWLVDCRQDPTNPACVPR